MLRCLKIRSINRDHRQQGNVKTFRKTVPVDISLDVNRPGMYGEENLAIQDKTSSVKHTHTSNRGSYPQTQYHGRTPTRASRLQQSTLTHRRLTPKRTTEKRSLNKAIGQLKNHSNARNSKSPKSTEEKHNISAISKSGHELRSLTNLNSLHHRQFGLLADEHVEDAAPPPVGRSYSAANLAVKFVFGRNPQRSLDGGRRNYCTCLDLWG